MYTALPDYEHQTKYFEHLLKNNLALSLGVHITYSDFICLTLYQYPGQKEVSLYLFFFSQKGKRIPENLVTEKMYYRWGHSLVITL